MEEEFLRMENARTPEQKELMERIQKDGVCPFCAEHFKKYHPKPVLRESNFWFVTENISPYTGTKHHFILVYKPEHATSLEELSPEAFSDLLSLMQVTVREFKIPGGSFFMRFGDTKYTGSSVAHLHAHVLMGDADSPDHEAVRVKLG
jgi:diadenosine tetraphosphate (Ap4A) HIT family hydrolase